LRSRFCRRDDLGEAPCRRRAAHLTPAGPQWLGRFFPDDPKRAFAAAVVTAALLGVAIVLLGVVAADRGRYGWTLFVLGPFAMGFVAASLTTYRQEPTLPDSVLAGTLSALAGGACVSRRWPRRRRAGPSGGIRSIAAPVDTWFFRAGVAYPVSAELAGAPGVLREWTPYRNVHPPHLDAYVVPESADFRLVALENARGHERVPQPHVARPLLARVVGCDRVAGALPGLSARQTTVRAARRLNVREDRFTPNKVPLRQTFRRMRSASRAAQVHA
jgi:hypothetical protein